MLVSVSSSGGALSFLCLQVALRLEVRTGIVLSAVEFQAFQARPQSVNPLMLTGQRRAHV
ncbi:hypothetical protein Tamer19_07130 [Cupriavidus sp. TA19]|nr:hypothetical protein Tamer19_07130 [Cupriavidus sp. TA19]